MCGGADEGQGKAECMCVGWWRAECMCEGVWRAECMCVWGGGGRSACVGWQGALLTGEGGLSMHWGAWRQKPLNPTGLAEGQKGRGG